MKHARSFSGDSLMNLPDFLTTDGYGFVRVVGHRIGLNHVVNLYNEGHSAEQILEDLDTLSVPLINQVIAFYQAHKVEVDAYIAEHDAEVERQIAAAPKRLDMDELRRKYAMKYGRENA